MMKNENEVGKLSDSKVVSMEKFMDMSQNEKHYILLHKDIYRVEERRIVKDIVDTDEKLGFYIKSKTLSCNLKGAWYIRSILSSYIVYNKSTRKVVMTKDSGQIGHFFLNHYFKYNNLISKLNLKLTPTLCKKIIEGSVNTLEDFVKYVRSYVVRDVRIPLDVLVKYMVSSQSYLLPIIEDPENLVHSDQLIVEGGIPIYLIRYKPFKLKINELKDAGEKLRKFIKEKDKEFNHVHREGESGASFNSF